MKLSTRIQLSIDGFWARTLFDKLPPWVRPNHLTLARLALLPAILALLLSEWYFAALAVFVIAALLDSMDGALARVRDQKSDLGAWLDPMADKFLVIVMLVFFYGLYPYQSVILAAILLEAGAIIGGAIAFWGMHKVQLVTADWWGKSKLVCQVIGILLALLYFFVPSAGVLAASALFIGLSVVLALASVFNHFVKYSKGIERND